MNPNAASWVTTVSFLGGVYPCQRTRKFANRDFWIFFSLKDWGSFVMIKLYCLLVRLLSCLTDSFRNTLRGESAKVFGATPVKLRARI